MRSSVEVDNERSTNSEAEEESLIRARGYVNIREKDDERRKRARLFERVDSVKNPTEDLVTKRTYRKVGQD
jgi:hypothetical protein